MSSLQPFGATVPLPYAASFTREEFERLQSGLAPRDMDDKWRVVYDEPWLTFYRSWTGLPVYRLKFAISDGGARVAAGEMSEEVARRSHDAPAYDVLLVDFLVRNLMLGQDVAFPMPGEFAGETAAIYQHHVAGGEFRCETPMSDEEALAWAVENSLAEPSPERISEWLRTHLKKRRGFFARLFGEPAEYDYDVGPARPVPVAFITRQTLFTLLGEWGMFPIPCLPRGSRGFFAMDGEEIYMLHPDVRSLGELLARERRPLDDGDPADLGRLFCRVLLAKPDATGDVLVQSADELRSFQPLKGYIVDEVALRNVEGQIVPPSVHGDAARGWTLEFTTVHGWMHETKELGIEKYGISSEFVVARSPRRVLHRRIFRDVPHVMY